MPGGPVRGLPKAIGNVRMAAVRPAGASATQVEMGAGMEAETDAGKEGVEVQKAARAGGKSSAG